MSQIKKYVLFSPVGTHDPIGVVDKDGKPSEGSMLHIIRHYKPEIVYIYITKGLNHGDDRYKRAIEKFYPKCKVENIFSELDKDKVNSYDSFMADFRKYIAEIYDKYNKKGYEILLNVASGTPQMKSNLILEVITNNIKLIPVQVSTPIKDSNFNSKNNKKILVCPTCGASIENKEEDIYTYTEKDLDRIDIEKENKENRCKEPEILSFKRAKIQSQIESLIKNYEYSAAYNLFKQVNDISELFDNNLLKYLQHAYLRVNLKYNEANKIINLQNKDLTDAENELLEYYYVMKLKYKKEELSDFILRISPFATDLLFYYLKNNIPELEQIFTDSNGSKKISSKIQKNNKLYKHISSLYKYPKFINLAILKEIKDYYIKTTNIIDSYTSNSFNQIRKVEEKIRNKVAHRIINITEEFINEKVGLSSEDILKKNEELLKIVIPKININNFIYDEINNKIIELLQKYK